MNVVQICNSSLFSTTNMHATRSYTSQNLVLGPDTRWIFWLGALTSLVTVCLRLWVRMTIKRTFGWDDRTLLLSLVSEWV